jgi:hypothetical protein
MGDRFVAVLALTPEPDVLIPTPPRRTQLSRVHGDHLTPPVVIRWKRPLMVRKLVIHGRHFEAPGAEKEDCVARAEAFKEARCTRQIPTTITTRSLT